MFTCVYHTDPVSVCRLLHGRRVQGWVRHVHREGAACPAAVDSRRNGRPHSRQNHPLILLNHLSYQPSLVWTRDHTTANRHHPLMSLNRLPDYPPLDSGVATVPFASSQQTAFCTSNHLTVDFLPDHLPCIAWITWTLVKGCLVKKTWFRCHKLICYAAVDNHYSVGQDSSHLIFKT